MHHSVQRAPRGEEVAQRGAWTTSLVDCASYSAGGAIVCTSSVHNAFHVERPSPSAAVRSQSFAAGGCSQSNSRSNKASRTPSRGKAFGKSSRELSKACNAEPSCCETAPATRAAATRSAKRAGGQLLPV